MRLVYFSGDTANFGDDLNRVLWPHFAPELFDPDDSVGFLGIGTIIGMPTPGCSFLHVFSSGVGYDRLDRWDMPHRVWCVRGPLTARALGCDAETAITDGAILAPWIMPDDGADPPSAAVGVVPHWESLRFPGWQEACRQAGFTLISPIDMPENVIRALRRTRLVLTESLHGAIVADSYGIPWIPLMTSRNFSVFKWMDWCLSMDVALAPIVVPPPSLAAALHFGRPPKRGWGVRAIFNADEAMTEFNARVGSGAAAPTTFGLRSRAVSTLRELLADGEGQTGKLASFAAGYHPGRTATHLVRASEAAATLSSPTLRDSLRDRMAELLQRLCHTAAPEHAA